jgi:hypothetical protein
LAEQQGSHHHLEVELLLVGLRFIGYWYMSVDISTVLPPAPPLIVAAAGL